MNQGFATVARALGRRSPSSVANLAPAVAIGLWYATMIVLAHTVADGIAGVATAVGMVLALGAYCATRPSRGDLVAGIAVAPIFAGLAAADLFEIPAQSVSYPGAVIALGALAWIERRDRRRVGA